jgi:hypothetical protein
VITLKKLLEDYSEFNRNKTSSRIALNCASTLGKQYLKTNYNSTFKVMTIFEVEKYSLLSGIKIKEL